MLDNKYIGERLRQLRLSRKTKQGELGKILGVQAAAVSKYELGERQLSLSDLHNICEEYEVTIDYFIPEAKEIKKGILLPIIGAVKAGPDGYAFNDFLGELYAEIKSSDAKYCCWLLVRGDSMIGEGIFPGDYVLLREQSTVEHGDLAVVIINQDEGMLKRVYYHNDAIELRSANPTYSPIFFKGKEINNVRIVGKIKEIKRKV